MLIISKHEDYYDYFTKIYGEDPKMVLDRRSNSVSSFKFPETSKHFAAALKSVFRMSKDHYGRGPLTQRLKILVFCGRYYLLASPINSYNFKIVRYGDRAYKTLKLSEFVPDINQHNHQLEFNKMHTGWEREVDLNNNQAIEYVYSFVNQPYFIVDVVDAFSVYLSDEYPILNDLGLSSIIEPYEAYKEIVQFISSMLTDSPDSDPPVELSNKDKIHKAGFDTVTSFRGKNK